MPVQPLMWGKPLYAYGNYGSAWLLNMLACGLVVWERWLHLQILKHSRCHKHTSQLVGDQFKTACLVIRCSKPNHAFDLWISEAIKTYGVKFQKSFHLPLWEKSSKNRHVTHALPDSSRALPFEATIATGTRQKTEQVIDDWWPSTNVLGRLDNLVKIGQWLDGSQKLFFEAWTAS